MGLFLGRKGTGVSGARWWLGDPGLWVGGREEAGKGRLGWECRGRLGGMGVWLLFSLFGGNGVEG